MLTADLALDLLLEPGELLGQAEALLLPFLGGTGDVLVRVAGAVLALLIGPVVAHRLT